MINKVPFKKPGKFRLESQMRLFFTVQNLDLGISCSPVSEQVLGGVYGGGGRGEKIKY